MFELSWEMDIKKATLIDETRFFDILYNCKEEIDDTMKSDVSRFKKSERCFHANVQAAFKLIQKGSPSTLLTILGEFKRTVEEESIPEYEYMTHS